MRYTIPRRKEDQEKERGRILRATASNKELLHMQQALDWMLGYVDGTIDYNDRRSYQKLYDISKTLGITEGKKEAAMFPPPHSKDNFEQHSNDLWRILQVYAQEKTPTLLSAYQKYKKEKDKYNDAFQKFDEEQKKQRAAHGMPELEPELPEDLPVYIPEQEMEEPIEEMPPLADANSIYAGLIKGSVYSELYGLYKDLMTQLRPGRNTADRLLSEDMNQLLSNMQFHYLRRNPMGNVLPMTQDEKKELSELYRSCLRDCKRLPDKLKKKQEYKKLHSLLSKNEEQLRRLPKGKLLPLADVIRGLNDHQTIRLIAQEKETVGMAGSGREAVEYTDAEGNIRRGFFTAERKLGNADAELDEIVDKYDRQYPKYSDYFKKIKSIKNDPDFQIMLDRARDYHAFGNKDFVGAEPVKKYFRNETDWIRESDQRDTAFWNKIMIPMITEMAKSANLQGLLRKSGFGSNDLLAERANAMGDVAKALGYPNLLVGTKQVTVKRGDRTETGVMMEPADMDLVDPVKITKDHPFYNLKETDFNNRKFLSSLADLQILDYLCANTDRHNKNFFLRMDLRNPEEPKLLGVQGIDNDNSFGDLEEGGMFKLAKSSNLKIITPKMAAAITAMTWKQLKDILKPYHLSGPQLEAAGDRLEDLQRMIERGKKQKESPFIMQEGEKPSYDLVNTGGTIHIMEDGEWEKLTLKALLPKNMDDKNIFYFANTHRNLIVDKAGDEKLYQEYLEELKKAETPEAKKQLVDFWNVTYKDRQINAEGHFIGPEKKEEEPAPLRYTKQADEVDYTKLAKMQKKELEDLNKMLQQFHDAHGGEANVNRSEKFKTMRAALVDLSSAYLEMERLNPDNVLIDEQEKKKLEKNRDKNLLDCYKQIEEKRQNLKRAVDTYLGIWHWRLKPSENNQKRIDTAKQLSGLVMDAPSSEQFYKSSRSLRDAKRSKAASKDSFEQGRYFTNEIHSRMKLTLRDNVNALKPGDPLRAKGVEVMKAHERLWNYSQSRIYEETAATKTTIQKTSLTKLLEEKNREKQEELPNKEQICADLEAIKEYAQGKGYNEKLAETIERILKEDSGEVIVEDPNVEKGITPRRVGGILNELFISGSKALTEQKEVVKKQEIDHSNDICTTIKKQ